LIGSVSTPASLTCNGTVVWTYRYTACDGTTTADWTKTYTVTYSGGLTAPANGSSTVAGPAQAVNPGPPASITDACGRTVTASYVGKEQTPDPVICAGTIIYRYRYTACDGETTADWTYTYTVTTCTISGTVKYNNTAKTPMRYVEVTLTPTLPGTPVMVTTAADGSYTFANMCPDTYTMTFKTVKPVGGINSTDAAGVNFWFTNASMIENVKFLAGDVSDNYEFSANDAQRIQNNFVFGDAFLRAPSSGTSYVFWQAGDFVLGNPSTPAYPYAYQLPVVCTGNMTVPVYGQVIGDFNGSFNPTNSMKSASQTLELVYTEPKLAGTSSEIEMPVRMMHASTLGAVSLILNFPTDLMEVTGVTMQGQDGKLAWAVMENELRIGWNSTESLSFESGQELLVIHARTSATFGNGSVIRLELAADQLNELADGNIQVITDAVIGVNTFEFSTNGIVNPAAGSSMTLESAPNPFANYTMLTYTLPADGQVTLAINDMLGRTVATLVKEQELSGKHSVKLDGMPLQPGVYFATVTLTNNSGTLVRTIKLVHNR
jgi:hypothetical protein